MNQDKENFIAPPAMGYGQTVLLQWSQRDRLATIVIAVAVASLVGTALLLTAAGAQSAAIAGQYSNSAKMTHYDSLSEARSEAAPSDIMLPTARVTQSDGATSTVVGVPQQTSPTNGDWSLRTQTTTGVVTQGTLTSPNQVTLAGAQTTTEAHIVPRKSGATIFPADWYVTDAATVQKIGPTGAFVLQEGKTTSSGTPLLSALIFFQKGTEQALRALTATAVGSALLIGVTIYSVTRMSIRDRLTTISVARSTGAPPRRILALFTVRATLLTAVGIALGYALGVIIPNAAVSAAVTLGVPVALPIRVTTRVALALLPIFGGLLLVGVVAGVLGTWPTIRRPPGQLETSTIRPNISSSWIPRPQLVDWRALVPTATTLAAFVTFVIIMSSIAGVVGPMVAANGATITEPGSKHPVSSHVPEGYATTLQQQGIDASPEILLFEVARGSPFPARGVNYSAFANVTDAQIVDGRRPQATDEVVIGTDLAHTLNVDVGENLTLGGSTAPAIARVEVVGIFAAPNPYDDQLLTSLPLARHLTTIDSPDAVNLIRADRLPETAAPSNQTVIVSAVSVSSPVPQSESTPVNVTVRNTGSETASTTVPIQIANQTRNVTFDVPANGQRTKQIAISTTNVEPGTHTLRVGSQRQSVTVVRSGTLFLRGLPSRAPPGSEPLVQVITATNSSVSDARITVGGETVLTNSTGHARLPLQNQGQQQIVVQKGNRTTNATVTVQDGASRRLIGSVRVTPASPTVLTTPTAHISLYNPWNTAINQTISIDGPGVSSTRTVTLSPGERTTVTTKLVRKPPGSYQVQVQSNGEKLTTTSYEVTGDDRIASMLASNGQTGSTGLGQAISVAFGNIWVVVATILGLAGLMTIGGTTATFAQSIHARRQTIGIRMATGATQRQIFALATRDALLIGSVASVIAVVLGLAIVKVLDLLGYLIVFGVNLSAVPDLSILLVTVGASILLTVLGSTITVLGLLRSSPRALLADRSPTRRDGGESYE